MRTRTRLTTPPGQEPALSEGPSASERYVPGLGLPEEPHTPGRRRRLWLTLAVLVLVVVGSYVAFRVATAGQQFDPALDPGIQAPADAPQAPAGDG